MFTILKTVQQMTDKKTMIHVYEAEIEITIQKRCR